MKIKDLEKEHQNSKYKCEKCSNCFCTACLLERANEKGQGFDIIDKKIYCSKHRYDKVSIPAPPPRRGMLDASRHVRVNSESKVEVVYLPSIYKD